jgi:coxsackievirus/adenovirus receptor
LDCPACYNLVQDAANEHRSKLSEFGNVLTAISENPTVIEDSEFELKLAALNEKVDIVLEDAKAGAGSGTGKSLTQNMDDLKEKLSDVEISLKDVVRSHDDSKVNLNEANNNLDRAKDTIQQADDELNVSSLRILKL